MFKLSECISNEIITYPVIRSLKGKYRLTDAEIASIIGDKAYQTYAKKLNCESEFSSSNMINLYNYFKSRGEEGITIQGLFFDWIFSIEK